MVRTWLFVILSASLLVSTGCNRPAAPANSTDSAAANPSTAATPDQILPRSATTAHPERGAVEPASPGSAADAPDTSVADDKRPRLVCFGDSLTAGYGTEPGESYPDFLQRDLNAAGYKYRVINEGISGNTTKDGLARIGRVLDLHPALAVVEFGGNDGLRGLPIVDTRANLDTIVSRLQAAHIPTVVAGITLPPSYGGDYVRQFNQTYVLLASHYKVPMIPFILQNVYGVDGLMQADNIHATAAGNRIVAQNILRLIQPLLKK